MELVDGDVESPTLISNVEVMELLKKNIEARKPPNNGNTSKKKKRNKHFRHRDWVEEEVHSYLMTTPCVKLDPSRRQEFHSKLKSRKKIKPTAATSASAATTKVEEGHADAGDGDEDMADNDKKKSAMAGFGLTEAETLQIMNMMPTEPVEIHLMVDDLQSRMTETQQEEFLEFIGTYSIPEGAAAAAGTSSQSDPMEIDNPAIAKKWLNGQHKKQPVDNDVKVKQEDDESESEYI